MTQLEDGKLAARGVGRERGHTHPFVIGDPQLRSGVGAFLPLDHPHPGRPPGQVQQPGQLGHERPVPDPVVFTVIGGGPRARFINTFQQVRRVRGKGEPDRVGQTLLLEPTCEVLGAAGPVGADQDLLRTPPAPSEQVWWELGQSLTGDADVIAGGV